MSGVNFENIITSPTSPDFDGLETEDQDVQYESDQDGFFGDFCLMCGIRCLGGHAYCSTYCQQFEVNSSVASTASSVISLGHHSSTTSAPAPLVKNSLMTLPSPPSTASSASSTSGYSARPPRSTARPTSRPPPSPSIKATLAGPSLSDSSVALPVSGPGRHASHALRQALGTLSVLNSESHWEPIRRASVPVPSNWLKSLVTSRKENEEPRPKMRSRSESIESISLMTYCIWDPNTLSSLVPFCLVFILHLMHTIFSHSIQKIAKTQNGLLLNHHFFSHSILSIPLSKPEQKVKMCFKQR